MEQEIQRRVLTLTKQNQDKMAEETGIQSSLTEEDMIEYLEQVIDEAKKGQRLMIIQTLPCGSSRSCISIF
jgi:hypothetical protein